MSKKIEAIIWDLDGTLIDSDLYVVMNYTHMYQKYRPGYYPSLREMIGFSGPSVVDTIKEQFPKENVEELVKEFEDYSKKYQSSFLNLYKGEMDCVKAIYDKGLPMILLTNKKGESAKRCMESTGLIKYVPDQISLDDVKEPKPDPAGVLICLNKLGSKKENTMIIGDSSTDVLAGQRAGILTGIVTWSLKGLPKEKSDYKFDSFEQIKEFVLYGKYKHA